MYGWLVVLGFNGPLRQYFMYDKIRKISLDFKKENLQSVVSKIFRNGKTCIVAFIDYDECFDKKIAPRKFFFQTVSCKARQSH